MNDQEIDKMVGVAMEKQSLIEAFLNLTEEQAEAIQIDNYDSILNIINKKQNIMEQVNLLDLNSLGGITPDDNGMLRIINEHTREIMSQAIALEDKNILAIKKHQTEIFEKLKNVKQNKLIHWAYRGKNMNMEGILVDKKK